MIKNLFYIFKDSQKLFWFLFHIIIGIVSTNVKEILIIWFYLIFLVGLYKIASVKNLYKKQLNLIYLLFYLSSFEIITRMARTTPIIPDEIGKYFNFFLLSYAVIISDKRRVIGYFMLLLLVPSIIIGSHVAPDYRFIVFNILGLINLCLGVVFFGKFLLHSTEIVNNLLRLLSYSLISALSFAIIKTPDYNELAGTLNANIDASGGFGSNQVSTAFGLGFFIMFYLWFKNVKVVGYFNFLDLALALLFLFQGLLTFSRGGVIGGVIGVIMLLFYSGDAANRGFIKKIKLVALGIPLLFISIVIANNLTDGNLLLRYQGETNSTLNGIKEKDLNHITTNRFEIFLGDIELFAKKPILGVGVSNSKNLRTVHENVAAHVELSRLLAEHGILGLIFFIILIYFFVIRVFILKTEYAILYILAIIGLYSSFHAATRTFISPLLIPLMLTKITVSNKTNVSRLYL